MMDKSFGLILAVIALVAGIMLLTGHGDILLKGGNTKLRKEKNDMGIRRCTSSDWCGNPYRQLYDEPCSRNYLYHCTDCNSRMVGILSENEVCEEIIIA